MSEQPARYDAQDQQPCLDKLVGRRVELVRLLQSTKAENAGMQCLLLMLDDGSWFWFLGSGQFLPLRNNPTRDIHTLMHQGEDAYEITEMAVANPDEPNQ